MPRDLVFVKSSWLKSYASSDWAKLVTPRDRWEQGDAGEEYYHGHRSLIDRVLGHARVVVADDGILQGWACAAGKLLHYVYVRHSARKTGLAKRLLEALELEGTPSVTYTHRSRGIDAGRVPRGWHFNPYPLFAC